MKKLLGTILVVLILVGMVGCSASFLIGKGSKSKPKANNDLMKEIEIENIEVEEIEVEKIIPEVILVVG